MRTQRCISQAAFTLLELSVVIVIIGLLLGSLVGGRSLIRSAELRNVVSESEKYIGAYDQFQSVYNSLAGDFTRATSYWGTAGSCGSTGTGSATSFTATCNGSGDGFIGPDAASPSGTASDTSKVVESILGWQHLALGGLIEGRFNGYAPSGSAFGITMTPGANVPNSKIEGAYWLFKTSIPGSTNDYYTGGGTEWRSALRFGSASNDNGTQSAQFLLTPEEAFTIDSKVDDGIAGSGKAWGLPRNSCGNTANINAPYNLTAKTKACYMLFWLDRTKGY